MSSRSRNRHSRYDDPYVYDDPYLHSNPSIGKDAPAYEYVGTDEASIAPESPRHSFPSGHEKRHGRTTSSPRRSRFDEAHSPPHRTRKHSPPSKTSQHSSSRGRDEKKAPKDKYHRYHDFIQRPGVQRTKSIGRQGLSFLSEAAAAYAAAQAAGGDPRGRSADRPSQSYHSSPEPRRSRRSRRHSRSPSSSPSPSPPRRRSTTHGDRHRPRNTNQKHKSYSSSPPPGRGQDSDHGRDRGRRHRQSNRDGSPSRSPSRRNRRRGHSGPSTSSGFRPGTRDGKPHVPDKATATRWQMAARAALEAGGVTAFRLRKEPGSWTGEKGAKIATAALGAAAIDAFIDKDPRRSKSQGRGVKGMAENAVSSLIASQLMGFKGSSTRSGKSRY
ncbi:hypothetical protein F5X99DRAFT_217940 [Biscogniauxia marginata]|nr:hypothetical protein F5X99DRAFT_217940 [Biscogniauxia marginata]